MTERNSAKNNPDQSFIFDADGVKTALLNVLEDAKIIQKEAQQEREKAWAVLNGLIDGVLVLDSRDRITFLNPKAEEYLGMSSQEAAGKPIANLKKYNILSELLSATENNNIKTPKRDFNIRDSLILEVSVSSLPIFNGKPGHVIVLRNVTRERTIERIKTEFVSLAAHQLRTPLSAIKWTLKMLLEGDLGGITREQSEWLQKTYSSNERMISLINDLLEVTRIEGGEYLYNISEVRLEDIAEATVNAFQDEAVHRGIKLIFNPPGKGLPKIKADAEKLKLVITNFIDNALRYSNPGGEIKVVVEYNNNGMRCAVQDRGIGISQKEQHRVFERFFRASSAVRQETEGSGLGLYISKKIIEAHKGKIWFSSKENEGSVFSFWVPLNFDAKEDTNS